MADEIPITGHPFPIDRHEKFTVRIDYPPELKDSPLLGASVRLKAGMDWERRADGGCPAPRGGWVVLRHCPPLVFMAQEGTIVQPGGSLTCRVINEAWIEPDEEEQGG